MLLLRPFLGALMEPTLVDWDTAKPGHLPKDRDKLIETKLAPPAPAPVGPSKSPHKKTEKNKA